MAKFVYAGEEWKVSLPGASPYQPQIELLPDGNYVVAYHQNPLGYYVIVDSSGEEIFRGTIEATNDATVTGVGLQALSGGGFVVSWQQGTSYGVQSFSADGTPIGSPVEAIDLNQGGTLLDFGGGEWGFVDQGTSPDYARTLYRYDDEGALVSSFVVSRGYPEGGSYNGGMVALEQIETLADGNFLLVERRMVGVGEFVREAIVSDASGNRSDPVALTGQVLALAGLDDGRFVVVSRDDDAKVYLQFLGSDGEALGGAVELDPAPTITGNLTVVSMDAGAFAFVYDGPGSGNGSDWSDVWLQSFDSDGSPMTDAIKVNRVGDGSQQWSDAVWNDGELTIVWNDFRSFALGGIYTQSVKLVGDDFDSAPTGITVSQLTVNENAAAGTVVANLGALDPSMGDSFTFSLPDGSVWFDISGGNLVVKAGVTLDYETATELVQSVLIQVEDGEGNIYSETFDFTLADVIEPIMGNDKKNRLEGTSGNDTIYGLGGKDTLIGKAGVDHLHGGDDDDTYIVSAGVKYIYEAIDGGRDTVKSSIDFSLAANVEVLLLTGRADINGTGNAGANSIVGNSGENRITGGLGKDSLEGGGGADVFAFMSIADSSLKARARDTVADFSRKEGDKVDLSPIDANTSVPDDQEFGFIGKQDFSRKAGELRYEKAGKDTLLSGDDDGDGKADFSILFEGNIKFKEGDFIL